MNPLEMVVAIVAIVMITGLIKARMGIRRGPRGEEFHVNDGESSQLREEVQALRSRVESLERIKERVEVLERIATDKGNLLEQEFERLRLEK